MLFIEILKLNSVRLYTFYSVKIISIIQSKPILIISILFANVVMNIVYTHESVSIS